MTPMELATGIIRKHIQNWIEDYQTTDCYDIGSAKLNWLRDREEWQLILPNGEIHYEGSGCGVGDLLSLIDDADIADYFTTIADYFSECEDIPAEDKEAAE